MTADLRGFKYPLEPLLRRQRWRLETLLTELGKVQKARMELFEVVEELKVEYRAESRDTLQAIIKRCDPSAYGRRLAWLVHLQGRISDAECRLDQLEAERRSLQKRYLTQRQRLDVLEEHRESAVNEYARFEAAHVTKASDQDWLMRQPSRRRIVHRRTHLTNHEGRVTRTVGHG